MRRNVVRQALALFPIDLVIADVLGPGTSSSVGDPSIVVDEFPRYLA
jgi:hypothetical protein